MSDNWIEVSRRGLAKLIERQGRAQAVRELVANALDTDAKNVSVTLEPIAGRRGMAHVVVEDDDPHGFSKLDHAWTLFAESERKADPTKRGRFNMGEKVVLSLCESAVIETVKGSVRFDAKGRHESKKGRKAGSAFRAVMHLTLDDIKKARALVHSILVPVGVTLTVDGEAIPHREAVRELQGVSLDTELADGDGVLRRSTRKTTVRLVEPMGDEEPSLYELGVPVRPLDGGERWHIDVQQKVPLTTDRENVTPAFMRDLRVAVLNASADLLSPSDVSEGWVRQATGDKRSAVEAVRTVATLRFGENAVAADPNDREAEKRSAAQGRQVIHGRSNSKEEWESFRRAGVLPPAGKVTPTPKPYGQGEDVEQVPREKWTPAQRAVVDYMLRVGAALIDRKFEARIERTTNNFIAAYGKSSGLSLNVMRLGHKWFERGARGELDAVNELLIHELGHEYCSDHLSSEYHDALCRLGAKLARLALQQPDLLKIGGDA